MPVLMFRGGPWDGQTIISLKAPGLITVSWIGDPTKADGDVDPEPVEGETRESWEGYYIPTLAGNSDDEVDYGWQ